jgi:hypothetical protein
VIFDRPGWPPALRVVVYRKRVFHESRKNFQLDLFTPDDGHFEYSAVATSLDWDVARLFQFMAGRGGHEKTLGELKSQFAFDAIPTNHREANSAWQMLCVLAFNLVRSFQIMLGAPRRARTWKHTFGWVFQSLSTLRFELIHQPVRLVRPQGRAELRFAVPPAVEHRIGHALRRIAAVA